MTHRLMTALALVAAALMAGCAAPPSQDLRTASDMTDNDRRAKLRLELAAGYYGRGQSTTALDEIKQALAARPDMVEGYNLRGLIYASLEEPKLAEESFQRALQIDARNADTMHNYGWFMCQSRRWDEAGAMFDRAVAVPTYREVPRTLLAKGLCEARAGRLKDADRTLTRSYEMDPRNPGTAFNLGEVLYKLGEFERARFYLRRVNAESANANAQTLWLAARIEHKLSNAPGVRGLGDQLRQRFPQSPETLLYETGRFDG
jgi:type IV pilus assembly protein PilF